MATERTIEELNSQIVEIFGQDAVNVLLEADDSNLQQFPNFMDWLTTLMFVGTRHALPELSDKEVVNLLEIVARRVAMPGFKHRWDWARRSIERLGMKNIISRIKIELDRTLHGDKA
jgi:hypothetical protein